MSSFGHTADTIIENPTYGSKLHDPAQLAAERVLEEHRNNSMNGGASGKTAGLRRVPLLFKVAMVLVLLFSITSIVLVLLMCTGQIKTTSSGSSSNQDSPAPLSNTQLHNQIVQLLQKVKELQDANVTTWKRIQAQETKEQNDVVNLQKAINYTIDKCNAGDNTLATKLSTQETKEQNDINQISSNLQTVNSTLVSKINAVTKMEGPRGYNGSQGPQGAKGDQGAAGAKGDTGLQGIKGDTGLTGAQGAGNLSQCIVKSRSAETTPNANSTTSIFVLEETGKKILHYSCSSNIADTLEQFQTVTDDGRLSFLCKCYGKGSYSLFSGITMKCHITYTECPLIS